MTTPCPHPEHRRLEIKPVRIDFKQVFVRVIIIVSNAITKNNRLTLLHFLACLKEISRRRRAFKNFTNTRHGHRDSFAGRCATRMSHASLHGCTCGGPAKLSRWPCRTITLSLKVVLLSTARLEVVGVDVDVPADAGAGADLLERRHGLLQYRAQRLVVLRDKT